MSYLHRPLPLILALRLCAWIGFSSMVVPCPAQNSAPDESENVLREEARKMFKEKVTPFVEKYCLKCHGPRPKAGINLESALKNPGSTSAYLHWKKAVANVKVHDMPPEDAPRIPTDEERGQFIEWVGHLKHLAPRDPGPFVMRRLTRVEYGNTLHDLYGVDPSIANRLPEEVGGEGYLNSITPLQSELFLEIANEVVDQVLQSDHPKASALKRTLFGAVPSDGTDLREEARRIARTLARDAFRRPPNDAELDVLVDVFQLGRDNGLEYAQSLGLMFKAVLVSPQFLFITPAEEVGQKSSIRPLDDYQLASRLSYLLWSAPPDPTLAALADQGELHKPDVLRAEVVRLLQSPRSRALFDGFGAQWLRVHELDRQVFDPEKFPEMTPSLRQAMMDEARLFFESIVQENLPVARFVDSDYTFLNEPLARFYGVDNSIRGPAMRKVRMDIPGRGGILGMSATLASTSFPGRTSPVRRGVWVLEQILGERIPPPPPDVLPLDSQDPKNVEGLTLRQRTELHVKDPTCANCHTLLDPIGFGLENYDAIGRWRDLDEGGTAIDSQGSLPDGHGFSTPAELKSLLAAREPDLARNLTEKWMAYALGRPLEGYDEIVIDQLMERIAADKYQVRTLLTEVLLSYLFTHHRTGG